MVSKIEFTFSGLKSEFYKHPALGAVTTVKDFADIVGVARNRIDRAIAKYEMLKEKMVQEDAGFGREVLIANNRSRSKKANNFSKLFLTTRGMEFLTWLLKTERARAFRKDILRVDEPMAILATISK